MICDSDSDDIVYSNFYTGILGNYLKGSIRNAGMDPDNLPQSDPSKMNFGSASGDARAAKAWKDIWGCGQGIGVRVRSGRRRSLGIRCRLGRGVGVRGRRGGAGPAGGGPPRGADPATDGAAGTRADDD